MLHSGQGTPKIPRRKDERVLIHFDYDCFYASVVEAENPALKSLPLAIQQKQIIVTCNYEARRRGLHKLQLIKEVKKQCPDVVIVLGEDLTRFRDASKELYNFIRSFSWNHRVERLGFDEVWMDITDMVDCNVETLNQNDLEHSFFHLSRDDPTRGFVFDARQYAGHVFPAIEHEGLSPEQEALAVRLRLGSHLAMHLRQLLEDEKGYTSTVGISTSKLLSKLVGNMHKPRGQTTLVPPYLSSVYEFLDPHDIGAVPGIGFKMAQRLRQHHLGRKPKIDESLVYGVTKECVTVGDVRHTPDTSAQSLEKVLGGQGSPHGIGARIFGLIHGIDDSPVIAARDVPRQISIEDSYIRLDTMDQVLREMKSATHRLLERMRIDLTESDGNGSVRWMGRPETLRLTTRPRLPLNSDGTRARTFKRISRSAALPSFCFSDEHLDALTERLVREVLVPLFKKLHPEKQGWDLSLLNVAVTNMVDVGTSKASAGRDIHSMFSGQTEALRPFQVAADQTIIPAADLPSDAPSNPSATDAISGQVAEEPTASSEVMWEQNSDEDELDDMFFCSTCGVDMPRFARTAHERFHGANVEASPLV